VKPVWTVGTVTALVGEAEIERLHGREVTLDYLILPVMCARPPSKKAARLWVQPGSLSGIKINSR
jgi:hypothetical protein